MTDKVSQRTAKHPQLEVSQLKIPCADTFFRRESSGLFFLDLMNPTLNLSFLIGTKRVKVELLFLHVVRTISLCLWLLVK